MKSSETRYSIDGKNRLMILRAGEVLVPDGKFVLEGRNRLSYIVGESASWKREYHVPSRIDLEGNWALDADHNFVLRLAEIKSQGERTGLTLKGDIISVEGNRLALELKSKDRRGNTHIQILQFSGNWQADEQNRFTFALKRKARPDILVFTGSWEVNKNQQIVYRFEKKDGRKKTRIARTVLFEGFWRAGGTGRLRYILSGGIDSFFDFRVQAESPNLYPKDREIKYRLGVGLKGKKPAYDKIITLYGIWKFSRAAGVNFEMDYGKGKVESLAFGVNTALSKNDEVTFALVSRAGESAGLSLTVSRRFLKGRDAEAFVRLKRAGNDKRVEAGVKIPF
ncbi:MAG: hypothetical protein PHC33_02615 [Candidatus Omnitrophica bacterium]|nr:hypothetical protein [Candidatus Omnitrophota bacterium]